jgi:hypothetical protein
VFKTSRNCGIVARAFEEFDMVEPITTGALVAAALTAGAKAIGGEAVKDVYIRLKAAATRLLGADAEKLVENPDSEPRATIVVEEVEKQPDPAKAELRELALAVTRAVESAGEGQTLTQMVNTFNNYGSGQQYNAPGGTQNFGNR